MTVSFFHVTPPSSVRKTVLPEPSLAKQGVAYGFRKSVPLAQIEALNIFLEEAVAEGHVAKLGEFYVNKVIGGGQ